MKKYRSKSIRCEDVPEYQEKTDDNYVKPYERRRWFYLGDRLPHQPVKSAYDGQDYIYQDHIDYIDVEIDQGIVVYEDGGWDLGNYEDETDNWLLLEYVAENDTYESGMIFDDTMDILEFKELIPGEPGNYRIKGYIELVYDVNDIVVDQSGYKLESGYISLNKPECNVNGVKVTPIL